jgi:hypothetical protein
MGVCNRQRRSKEQLSALLSLKRPHLLEKLARFGGLSLGWRLVALRLGSGIPDVVQNYLYGLTSIPFGRAPQ